MFTIDSTEDRALSPVIGVILLVGITVILVAVVGGLVTDFGSDVEVAPNAQISTDFNTEDDYANLTHESGDELNVEELQVRINQSEPDDMSLYTDEDTLQAGDEIDLNIGGDGDSVTDLKSDDTFRILWVSENGREVLIEETVP